VKNLVNPKNQLKNHSGSTTKDAKKNLVTGQFAKVECPSASSVPNHARRHSSFCKFSDFDIWFENGSGKEETREEEL
jgi:hypothetical protein